MLAGMSQEACRLFVGTKGADTITFVCLRAGGYSILCNGQSVGTWSPDDLDACVSVYLGMVDRATPPGPDVRRQDDHDAGPGAVGPEGESLPAPPPA